MPEKKSTTLYDVAPDQIHQLQGIALKLVGKRSLSALVRYIAEWGELTVEGDNVVLVVRKY